jgi:hypothetical protein
VEWTRTYLSYLNVVLDYAGCAPNWIIYIALTFCFDFRLDDRQIRAARRDLLSGVLSAYAYAGPVLVFMTILERNDDYIQIQDKRTTAKRVIKRRLPTVQNAFYFPPTTPFSSLIS